MEEPGTSAIISKYTCGMSDFPMPDSMARSICFGTHVTYRTLEYQHYLSQAEFQEYMESYATNFDMHKDIVFNALVKQVSRNKEDSKWRLEFMVDGELRVEEYEKVAFCHGCVSSFSIVLTMKSIHFIDIYIPFTDIRRKPTGRTLRVSRTLRVQ
jgi:cation diffusion facilitator CzcD-associated flavoprotein CzcO